MARALVANRWLACSARGKLHRVPPLNSVVRQHPMARANLEDYTSILVESFYSPETHHRGLVHIRPRRGQGFSTTSFIECRDEMKDTSIYPIGTVFRIFVKEKVPKRLDDRPHLYSPWQWDFEVVKKP